MREEGEVEPAEVQMSFRDLGPPVDIDGIAQPYKEIEWKTHREKNGQCGKAIKEDGLLLHLDGSEIVDQG